MTPPLPSFRVQNDWGDVVLRDGLVLCFFMRRSHGEVAPGLWRALQAYCRAIPPQSLAWYVTDEGDWDPLDEKGWVQIRSWVLDTTWPTATRVHLAESCGEVRAYNFEYFGYWLDSPFCERDEKVACAAAFTLPTEYLLEHGPARVRALTLELARELPFNSGYASLAFLSPGGIRSPAMRSLERNTFRFPGLDIWHLSSTSGSIGTRVRGAYWLTFLGQPVLGQLGGADALRERLPPAISLEPLDSERLLLTLGEWPLTGAEESGDDMTLYRTLARILEPHLYQENISWLVDEDFERRWLRRFLD